MEKSDKDKRIEAHVRGLLLEIGENPDREGLQGTPDRVCRMFKEIYRGYDPKQAPKITTFDNGKDGIVYDNMVVDSGDFVSKCEHHMVFFWGKYWFAYIPNPKGKILGLSKIARVVDYCAARLQLQERLVSDIVAMLEDALGYEYPPQGLALVMKAHHGCYDKKTEVLTKRGFIAFPDLKEDDVVAQYDCDADRISFTRPYELIKYRYKGKMLHFRQKCLDLMVTPDHRMVYQTEWKHYNTDTPYVFERASNIAGKRNVFKKAAIYEGESEVEEFTFGKRVFTSKQFAQLMGLYLSEGWSQVQRKTGIVVISQDKKSWAYLPIKQIAHDLGFSEIEQSADGTNTCVHFNMYSKELALYLQQFGKSKDKYVPECIKKMSIEDRKEFLRCYFYGDGFYHQGSGYYQITTISEKMADDLQEMLILCGIDCSIVPRKGNGIDIIMHKQYGKEVWKDYVVSQPDGVREEEYDDFVYCVNVEKSALVVRRNYKVVISGTCKEFRGIKKKGVMTSSDLAGVFKSDPQVRNEFMQLVNSANYE